MKGISVNQPFATLIAMGYKTIETRVSRSSAATSKHRGKLLICTSQKLHPVWKLIERDYNPQFKPPQPFKAVAVPLDMYLRAALDDLWIRCGKDWDIFRVLLTGPPEPSAICTVDYKEVVDMTLEHQPQACYSIFGGARAMVLENIQRIEHVQIKGLTNGFHLGIFDVDIPGVKYKQ